MRVFKRDGHLLLWGGELLALHGDAREVLILVVLGSPLLRLLVDDEDPARGAGKRVNRVGACGDCRTANLECNVGSEAGGVVGTGTPDLVPRNEFGSELASTQRGSAIVDGDGVSVEGDGGRFGRTGDGLVAFREVGGGENERTGKRCDGAVQHGRSLSFGICFEVVNL